MSTFYKLKTDGTKSWYYCFVYHGKKYRGVGGTTKTQALRALDKVQAELIDGTFNITLHKPTNFTLSSFTTEFLNIRKHLKSHWREKIIAAHVLSYFGKTTRLDQISHRKSQGVLFCCVIRNRRNCLR